jgi:pimeloyl-ACP methyl ester carboxylesterase
MTTFVLVPGAWLGGWCWQKVTPLLRSAGGEVYPLTLTGLGERAHLGTPQTNLDTHIQDVVSVLEYEGLWDVVLVGHSYAGGVVTGVAHRVPQRLRNVVYLDASIPQDGRSLFDLNPPIFRAIVEEEARKTGDGWKWPLPDWAEIGSYISLADLTEADRAWMRARGTPHPLGTMTQPVRLGNPDAEVIPRTYVYCGPLDAPVPPHVEQARTAPGWRYVELTTSHWPMISKPRETAEILLAV